MTFLGVLCDLQDLRTYLWRGRHLDETFAQIIHCRAKALQPELKIVKKDYSRSRRQFGRRDRQIAQTSGAHWTFFKTRFNRELSRR
jgi:hypothetical protein